MKITLDIDRLLKEGHITQEEYDRLKSLASRDTASLAINILIAFGVIAVAGGTLALLQSSIPAICLGLILTAIGVYLSAAYAKQWGMLGVILLLIGSLTAGGGIIAFTDGRVGGLLIVTILYVTAALIGKSGLLSALSALSLLATVGGMTDYEHAAYFLAIEQPLITIVLFGALSLGAYLLSRRIPIDYARLAIIFSRTSLFIVNLGFWIGSLWGDSPGVAKTNWDYSRTVLIPDWVFAIAWAIALLAVGIWAAQMNKRWVVNLTATFGAIHFYTQWFERLGASPGTILIAGLVTIGIAVGIFKYNQLIQARLSDRDSAVT
jgi:iron complex transport system permease protein